jgi:hypothetical protein
MLSEGGMLHVAGLVALGGVALTTQFRFTVPVNPFDGVAVIVTVFPVVAPGLIVMSPLSLRSKVGGARMIVTVAGWLVTAPLVIENVKLSEPDNWAGGE